MHCRMYYCLNGFYKISNKKVTNRQKVNEISIFVRVVKSMDNGQLQIYHVILIRFDFDKICVISFFACFI